MILRVRRFTSCFRRTCHIRVHSGNRPSNLPLLIPLALLCLLQSTVLLAIEFSPISATELPIPEGNSDNNSSYFALANQTNPTQIPTSDKSLNVKINLSISGWLATTNASAMLRIGNKTFRNGLVQGRTVVFTFTPAEFASVNNGDDVAMLYDRVRLFGPLNKNNLN